MGKQPPRHRKQWTREDVRRLRGMAGGNTPTRVIGVHLGRAEPAIRQKAHEENISLKPTNQSPYDRRKEK